MRAVSTRFLEALRGSHRMAARATLLTTYQSGVTPTGTELVIAAGNVQSSSRNDIRSTLDLSLDGTGWDFSINGDLIPYGNEVFIERGIVFGGGIREWVSLGYFRIYAVEQDEAPNGQIRIEGRDRMSGIIDAELETPVQFTKTRTVTQIFEQLVEEVYPLATVEFDDSLGSTQIGRAVIMERDRYAGLRDIARAYGKIMYWDHEGVLQVKDPPNPSVSVWDINAGEAGVLIKLGRRLTREGIYNSVVAESQGSDTTTPKRGIARDGNANSPTYYYGDFGKVPRFYSSPFITTTTQARLAARNLLLQSIGRPHEVDLTAIPNPALEPLDPVNMNPGTGLETHVLDDLNIGLTDDAPLNGTTRNQFGLEIEEE
jgi:Domain of unknown function (DUF5047)